MPALDAGSHENVNDAYTSSSSTTDVDDDDDDEYDGYDNDDESCDGHDTALDGRMSPGSDMRRR